MNTARKSILTFFILVMSVITLLGLASCKNSDGNSQSSEDNKNIEQEQVTQGLDFQRINGKDEYCVTGIGIATELDIIIPSTYQGLPVTEIAENAFYYNGVGTAKEHKIQSMSIPASITNIGDFAFCDCRSLKNINVDENNAKYQSINGDLYNKNGTILIQYAIGKTKTSFSVPNSVMSIYDKAFWGCSTLASITIPNDVTSIGSSAFSGCPIKTANIPAFACSYIKNNNLESLTITSGEIIDNTLSYCDNLKNVIIGNNTTSIGAWAFRNCSSLTNITIDDSVTHIGESAFYKCDSLTNIYYKGNLKQWCNMEFANIAANPMDYGENLYINDKLLAGEVIIPNGETSICDYAFLNCKSLTSIAIPDSVTSIGYAAFSACPIQTATIPAFACSYIKNDNLESVTITSGDNIPYMAFDNCTNLANVTITDSVAEIEGNAFSHCDSLTNIIIPDSVISVGENAFYDCKNLTSVTIGEKVSSIGKYAFYKCEKLIEVCNKSKLQVDKGNSNYLSNNGYVGYYAKNIYTPASGTKKLSIDEKGYILYIDGVQKILVGYTGNNTNLVLPNNINSIYKYAFYSSQNLTNVNIPNTVNYIGEYAFSNCSNLTNIVIPNSITAIYESTFNNCSGLISITIPDSVTYIGDYAFYNCSSLKNITLPNGVTNIREATFKNCSSLTSIIIPKNVSSIYRNAFSNCSKLTSVIFEDTTTWYYTNSYGYWENKKEGWKITVTDSSENVEYLTRDIYLYKI